PLGPETHMEWKHWHQLYDVTPSLRARLRIVCRQIADALNECPPGPIVVVSACAGDGRDLLEVLPGHPRRGDASAALLATNAVSLARGRAAAAELGLSLRFLEADATRARSYRGLVPADLVIFSGILGHLRHADVPGLIAGLPMLCKTGASLVWNRHLV